MSRHIHDEDPRDHAVEEAGKTVFTSKAAKPASLHACWQNQDIALASMSRILLVILRPFMNPFCTSRQVCWHTEPRGILKAADTALLHVLLRVMGLVHSGVRKIPAPIVSF
eukprot:5663143-Pyramimonas_sp.AAC.1